MEWTLIFFLGSSLALTTSAWTYHYSDTALTWDDARQYCREMYTDMVIIQSQDENDHLLEILPEKRGRRYYWIGITKHPMNDTWYWVGNNSTWVGNESWAENEPNHNTDFCVELYVRPGKDHGKWNDENCSHQKYAVCFTAQCNETSCDRGRCQETINNITCICEPGFKGDRCQTEEETGSTAEQRITAVTTEGPEEETGSTAEQRIAAVTTEGPVVECPHLPQPDNGDFSCLGGNHTYNSTCQLKCHLGFLLIGSSAVTCGATGAWIGPRPICTSYKQALLAVAGCAALSTICCICFCWVKHRKRKKVSQEREPEEATSPASEVHG